MRIKMRGGFQQVGGPDKVKTHTHIAVKFSSSQAERILVCRWTEGYCNDRFVS